MTTRPWSFTEQRTPSFGSVSEYKQIMYNNAYLCLTYIIGFDGVWCYAVLGSWISTVGL